MGKTQGSACSNFFSRGGFSQFRKTGGSAPTAKRTIDYSLGIPAQGVADLSEYQDGQLLPAELIPAIAPISSVHEDADQAHAYRQRMIQEFNTNAQRSFNFLPEEYQGGTHDHILLNRPPHAAKIVERFWADDPLDPVANSDINRPLEILTIERYTPAANQASQWSENRGVGHYVFDPLSEQWYLVDRWGRGEKKKRSQTIVPYRQSAAAGRRLVECLNAVQDNSLQRPEEFPRADTELIEQRIKDLRRSSY